MGLNTRLKRLEQTQEPQGQYRLYSLSAGGDLTAVVVIARPTPGVEGLARLANGTEKAIVWKGKGAFIFDADRLTDKLWWIHNDGPIFDFGGSGLTEDDI